MLCFSATVFSATKKPIQNTQPYIKIFAFDDEFSSCGGWFKYKNNEQVTEIFKHWIRGVATGRNSASVKQIYELPTESSIWLYLDKFCENNPLLHWTFGATKMMDEIAPK
jgi:hypothetical protein